jgi:urease accessory protein
MPKSPLWSLGAALALALTLGAAQAAMGGTSGFAAGLAHPMTQLDHLFVMVAVGLLGALFGGRAVWLLPASFVSFTAIGEVLGLQGFGLPFGEIGIAGSVVALGLMIATRVAVPTLVATALVGVLAIFHGHAHGTETPPGVSAAGFAAGVLVATAALHGAGACLGMALARMDIRYSKRLIQLGGTGMAVAGVAMVAALF